jgi:DNA-binding NarL/FixJ family response regulator
MSPREQLSAKEIQVATMVWEGKTNPEIASVLGCTEQVIKNQLRGIFDKLGVWSRLELALYVAGNGGTGWAEKTMVRPSEVAQQQQPPATLRSA